MEPTHQSRHDAVATALPAEQPREKHRPEVQVRAPRASIILYAMTAVIGVLVASSAVLSWIRFGLGRQDSYLQALLSYFDVNGEFNVPAMFSTLLLLVAATFLFVLCGQPQERRAGRSGRWLLLGCLFAFLAADEALTIHEKVTQIMAAAFGRPDGALYHMWVIPYGIAVIFLGSYLLPFVVRLPRQTSRLCLLAGGLFVGGALGLELFQAVIDSTRGPNHPITIVLYHAEEAMEMMGVAVFIYAMGRHLAEAMDRPAELRLIWRR